MVFTGSATCPAGTHQKRRQLQNASSMDCPNATRGAAAGELALYCGSRDGQCVRGNEFASLHRANNIYCLLAGLNKQ